MAKLNRDELIRLVQHIMTTSGCVVDLDALLNQFESNVNYPNASELIFNPPSGKKLTAEQIVDLALER
jgi:ribosomal protein S7